MENHVIIICRDCNLRLRYISDKGRRKEISNIYEDHIYHFVHYFKVFIGKSEQKQHVQSKLEIYDESRSEFMISYNGKIRIVCTCIPEDMIGKIHQCRLCSVKSSNIVGWKVYYSYDVIVPWNSNKKLNVGEYLL